MAKKKQPKRPEKDFAKEFPGFSSLPEWARKQVEAQSEDHIGGFRSAVRIINSDGGCCLFMNAFALYHATDEGEHHIIITRNFGCHIFPVGKNAYLEERTDPEIISRWLKDEGT